MGENEELIRKLKSALDMAVAKFVEIETMPYPPDIATRRIARQAREDLTDAIAKAKAKAEAALSPDGA